MPLQRVKIISWKAAEGTYKGFSCVGLPYVSITAILQPTDCVALGAGPWSTPRNQNNYRLLWYLPPSVLTFLAGDGDAAGVSGWDRLIGVGGGVVFPFKCLRSAGRSPGAPSSTASSLPPFSDHSVACCHLSNRYNKNKAFSLTCLTYYCTQYTH